MNQTQEPQLQGRCPVGYFVVGEALAGQAQFSATHEGRLYYFVSEEARQEFQKDPERFVPAFGGHCAFGMSIEKEFEADPDNFKIIDDRLYLFLRNDETDALELWNREDEGKCLTNAQRHWDALQKA